MKKIFLILILTTAYLTNMTAQEFPTYDCELVKTFNVGTGDGEIMTNMKTPFEKGPTGIGFDKEGNLYICDVWNKRLIKFDRNHNFIKNYVNTKVINKNQLFKTNNNEFIGYRGSAIYIYDSNFNQKAFMSLRQTEYEKKISGYPNWIYYDNMLFTYLEDGSLLSIPEPTNNKKENLEKILNEEQTIKYLQDKYGTQDTKSRTVRTNNGTLTIDENGNVIVNGDIKTQNLPIFFNYKQSNKTDQQLTKSNNTDKPDYLNLFTDEYILNKFKNLIYLGKDNDNNNYWSGSKIYIFDKNGEIIEAFKYDKDKKRVFHPAIHPSGDIYFLGYDDKQVYLYRIKRVW